MNVQVLETFECSHQISPNCHFRNSRLVFLQILHQSSGSWDITPLYFLAKILYFKEPIKVQIWWNFTWAVESLKFCTLMGSFCPNHVQFQLKKYSTRSTRRRKKVQELSLITLNSHLNFLKKNSLFVWKMTWDIWWILTWAVNNPKICSFMGYFCQKYVTCELKLYRRVVSWKITPGFKNGVRNLVNVHTSSWK